MTLNRQSSLVALIAILIGCPGGTESADVVISSDAVDATRSYALGLEALTYKVGGLPRWSFDPEVTQVPVAMSDGDGDVLQSGVEHLAEVLVIPGYLFGVPWTEFAATAGVPQALPGGWVAQMQSIHAQVKDLGLPIVLDLNPVNMRYDNLSPEVKDDGSGSYLLQENWLNEYCPNPSAGGNPDKWPAAYARYVSWMVDLFQPTFVGLARRINLYEENCEAARPGAYASMLQFASRADEALKDAGSEVVTIVSVDVEDLYGYPRTEGRCPSLSPQECFEQRKSLLGSIDADRLGLASYPAAALTSIQSLPDDWLGHVAAAVEGRPLVLSGIGIPARPVETKSGVCVPMVDSSEELQRDFLDRALSLAEARSMDFVVWTAGRDYYDSEAVGPCNCSGPKELCDHLVQLGASVDSVRPTLIQGLFSVDSTARLAGDLWLSLLE